jgi:hypothetical protein
MKFLAVYQARLNEAPFSDAPMEALGVWLRLSTAAATLESDTLPFTKATTTRTMLLTAGVGPSEIEKAIAAGFVGGRIGACSSRRTTTTVSGWSSPSG